MKLNRLVAGVTIAGALGAVALGVGAGLANAAPSPVPLDPGYGYGPGPGPWHGDPQRGYFHGAPWGAGPGPWGWGAPPRVGWGGPLPPPGGRWFGGPINYWGYQETPIWNPGFNQWGIWLFGVWIPL
jgi:hypothetical protein